MKYSLGIDIGYSSVKVAVIDSDKELKSTYYVLHKGNYLKILTQILYEVIDEFGPFDFETGAITGSVGKKLANRIAIKGVNEIASTIEGCKFFKKDVASIIEIGGQSTRFISGIDVDSNKTLKIATNTDCAAGTGSFLEEQAARLNICIDEYSLLAKDAKSIPRIAGRCSVFAKTDIIHHQQEGVPFKDILKGLAYAIVKNYKGAVIGRQELVEPIVFVGGVAKNYAIVDALKDILDLNESLVIPEESGNVSSIGAAILSQQESIQMNIGKIINLLGKCDLNLSDEKNESLASLSAFRKDDYKSLHAIETSAGKIIDNSCFLGIDIGSTSTNLVLIDSNSEIITYRYLKTGGDPLDALLQGIKKLNEDFAGKINIAGLGVTGSGRYMIGNAISANVIKDEITAQAKAAVAFHSDVDTVFEIGGQDSKYISLRNGAVTDFQMNKICAAGTGSFLEEQAQKFNIPIEEFGDLALKGNQPLNLGERCTVFIESSISSALSKGETTENIVSGLCYSIAKNYLHRVVGQKKIGDKILIQGGIAFNQGVVNAMRIITQKEIVISPFFSVTGAFGAALFAKEEMGNQESDLRSLQQVIYDLCKSGNTSEIMCVKKNEEYNKKIESTIFQDYDSHIDPEKKTVGIPRALFTYGMFPMFNAIFKSLGFNVLLSDWSDEETIRLGQDYALGEACFPMKLVVGHVAELVSKDVDFIFFPDLYNIDHPGSESRQNYGCAYMQLAFKIVNQTMELEKKGIKLISPTIAFSMGPDFMRKSFANLGDILGRSENETNVAVQKGVEAYHRFEERMETNGKISLDKLNPDILTFVLVSKTYGVSDPVLNLGIPAKLMDMGYQVIPFFDLPEGVQVAKEHPNMFWPFGQHILEPAYLLREHPNCYPILFTHHGCGPDSVLIHYFKEILGEKSFLNIEIDEHASKTGVITRIEAFVNSLKSKEPVKAPTLESCVKKIKYKDVMINDHFNSLKRDSNILIPDMYPYSAIFKELLLSKGFQSEILCANVESVELGREHTLTNEYYSFTSLLGACINAIGENNNAEEMTFLIPQTEGSEVEGQYNRLIKSKLDQQACSDVNVCAPFLEDVICLEEKESHSIFYCLLAGDLVLMLPPEKREIYLNHICDLIRSASLNVENLISIARKIRQNSIEKSYAKKIFAIGEPMILYNDYLNDFTFRKLENQSIKVVYSPFSETLLMFWIDYVDQNSNRNSLKVQEKLLDFKMVLRTISDELLDDSPFEKHIETLVQTANNSIGYYAGAFARYRQSKVLQELNVDGIITANSTYENTGVSLNILHKSFLNETVIPILNLSFDGHINENDTNKVESFIYYL